MFTVISAEHTDIPYELITERSHAAKPACSASERAPAGETSTSEMVLRWRSALHCAASACRRARLGRRVSSPVARALEHQCTLLRALVLLLCLLREAGRAHTQSALCMQQL